MNSDPSARIRALVQPDRVHRDLYLSEEIFALEQALAVLPFAVAVAAASLLYVAVADLIPGLHRKVDPRSSITQVLLIGLGIALIAFAERQAH